MDYTPRQIWELLRSGQLKRALDSHTVWLCSSCYKCAVRCSTGIPFADVMYGIKRLGVKEKLNKKGIGGPVWSNTFLGNVRRFDKITDIAVMLQFFQDLNRYGFLFLLLQYLLSPIHEQALHRRMKDL